MKGKTKPEVEAELEGKMDADEIKKLAPHKVSRVVRRTN